MLACGCGTIGEQATKQVQAMVSQHGKDSTIPAQVGPGKDCCKPHTSLNAQNRPGSMWGKLIMKEVGRHCRIRTSRQLPYPPRLRQAG